MPLREVRQHSEINFLTIITFKSMEDFTALINENIKQAVLNNYMQTAEYTTAFNAVLPSLGLTIDNFNKYLNDAVAQGISPDIAMNCYLLTLSMKA